MGKRLLLPSDLPGTLWTHDEQLMIPNAVSDVYKAKLVSKGLLELAQNEDSGDGPVGGIKEEDTQRHFATRFSASTARSQLAVLDPMDELSNASDLFMKAFAGGTIGLLDIPCGAGAASVSTLATVAALREAEVVPRHPLVVKLVAGDVSEYACAYASEMIDGIRDALAQQAVYVDAKVIPWDVLDRESTTAAIHTWMQWAQNCREYFVILANFSGFLQGQDKFKKAQAQLGEVFRWAAQQRSTVIRRFYPSISTDQARIAWELLTWETTLPQWVCQLGHRLLSSYEQCCDGSEKGLLTGPMFAHVIANAVLHNIDGTMSQALPGGYLRYVDDIVLVGSQQDVVDTEKRLVDLLGKLGMSIREDKRFMVTTEQWLGGEHDFSQETERVSWRTFVGRMKQLILARPELTGDITKRLQSNGFRITPIDYSGLVHERSYLDRLRDLARFGWFRRYMHQATPEQLCNEAQVLRTRYQASLWGALKSIPSSASFNRKRMIYKLRRYASRLIYLAAPEDLPHIAQAVKEVPELELYGVIFNAIATRDVADACRYGANAAHSVAQALASSQEGISCSINKWTPAARQARAILLAHGLRLEGTPPEHPDDMERFCSGDFRMPESGKSLSYFQELTCLHGTHRAKRHDLLLRTAFDLDEAMIVEVEDILQQSY